MIPKQVLKKLITKRLADSKVLLENRRYSAAIYLGGYALELALKFRICQIMRFNRGFPETKSEFNTYYSDTRRTRLRSTIKELRDIRHHQLSMLLRYSGEQFTIETSHSAAWEVVKYWDPEMRYTNPMIRKQKAADFLRNCRSIIHAIM